MKMQDLPGYKDQQIPDAYNLLKIAILLALLLCLFTVAQTTAHWLDALAKTKPVAAYVKWLWVYAIGTFSSMVVLGLGIMGHDAVHKVLFRQLWLNEWLGGLISALALLPFNANRQFHLAHHSYAHQPGRDPENLMHNHPLPIALMAGAFIGLALQYRILLHNLFTRFFDIRYAQRVVKDLCLLSLAGVLYFVVIPFLGFDLAYSVYPMLLTLPVVFGFRALSDHYGLPPLNRTIPVAGQPTQTELDIWHQANAPIQQEITGWVVLTHPFLEWLWSNVNYHEVHHKFPFLSYRYLKPVFEATRSSYPYAVVYGYARSLLNQRGRKYYA